MSFTRPGNYPFPKGIADPKTKDYLEQLYRSLIDKDRGGEFFIDRAPSADLRALIVRPEWYGAKANGTADCTTAINAAATYSCANGIPLVFSEGTYIITPVSGANTNTLKLSAGILVMGAGAGKTTIKVKDSCGVEYFNLLGGTLTTTDLSNLEVCGITFDHNISSNGHSGAAPSAGSENSMSIGVFYGTNIRIHDCEIKNACSIQNIAVDGANCSDVWIERNTFRVIGDDPNNYAHDSSIVYTHCRTNGRVHIKDNLFIAAGKNVDANRTAIETHDSELVVSGNVIVNFQKGMNITGANTTTSSNIVVTGNTISGCKQGITLWTTTYGGLHPTGDGLDGVLIDGNSITIEPQATYGGSANLQGITFPYNTADLDANNIRITNNIIRTTLDTAGTAQSTDTMAIGWRCGTAGKGLRNSVVTNNTVINFPLAAVKFWCDLTNVDIVGNSFIECGSTVEVPPLAATYRTPVNIVPATVAGLRINRNYFYDSYTEAGGTTRCPYFIYLYQNTGVSYSGVEIVDNTFTTTGTAVTKQIWMDNTAATANATPYFRGMISGYLPTTLAEQRYALGSAILDPSDGHWHIIDDDQYTWNEELAYGTPKLFGLDLIDGADRIIGFATDTTRILNLCGANATTSGASIQLYGGGNSGGYGNAYVVTGTSAANRTSVFEYGHRNTGGYVAKHRVTYNANEDLGGTTTWAAGTTNTKAQYSGTPPASPAADSYCQYSADQTAGNAAPHFMTEAGQIIKLYQQTLNADLEEAYETPELDTEAEVIAALNATNAKLNDLITALQGTGLLVST